MRKTHGVIFAVIGFVLFFSSMEGWGVDWEKYSESNAVIFYYDTEGITYPSKDVANVWGKLIYKAKGITGMVEEYGKMFETLSHSINLNELHCAEKKMRSLSSVYFSMDGNIFAKDQSPETNWRSITPDSVAESLHKIVCK